MAPDVAPWERPRSRSRDAAAAATTATIAAAAAMLPRRCNMPWLWLLPSVPKTAGCHDWLQAGVQSPLALLAVCIPQSVSSMVQLRQIVVTAAAAVAAAALDSVAAAAMPPICCCRAVQTGCLAVVA